MLFRWYRSMTNKDSVIVAPKVIKPAVDNDKTDKEVVIPVGGITDDGTVYEKEVKVSNEPIYKEVRIDETDDNGKANNKEKNSTTNES